MKNTDKFYNAALYIRLSREDGDKEESYSVVNQRKLLMDYINRREDIMFYDTYIDDGYTGTNFNRPAFRRMMDDIDEGNVNCVVVKDLSRFGRDYIDTGRYLERIFPDMGVRFVSVTDDIDSIKRAYDMLLPIKNIFNEQYARDISNKIHATIKTKQQSGQFIGAFTSYGYKKSPDDKNKLIIDEYAAGVVRKIFDLYVRGHGKQTIAKLLNEEGILCPAEYKKVNGENYKNYKRLDSTTYWTYSTINNILHKEIYIGNMVQGTKSQRMRSKQRSVDRQEWIVVKDTHEPIIDMETWNKAQILLEKRKRDIGLDENVNIFAGFIKCADCGRSLVKNMYRRKDGSRVFVLFCSTYKRCGKHLCTPHTLPMEVLEEIVLSDINSVIQELSDMKSLAESHDFGLNEMKTNNKKEEEKITEEMKKIRRLKKDLYEDYKSLLITKEEFLSYREDYMKKEELYEKQLSVLKKGDDINGINDIFDLPSVKNLLEMKGIDRLDRGIIAEVIDEIIVYGDRRLKIRYRFSEDSGQLLEKISEHKIE